MNTSWEIYKEGLIPKMNVREWAYTNNVYSKKYNSDTQYVCNYILGGIKWEQLTVAIIYLNASTNNMYSNKYNSDTQYVCNYILGGIKWEQLTVAIIYLNNGNMDIRAILFS